MLSHVNNDKSKESCFEYRNPADWEAAKARSGFSWDHDSSTSDARIASADIIHSILRVALGSSFSRFLAGHRARALSLHQLQQIQGW
jgi:hypothetical protein